MTGAAFELAVECFIAAPPERVFEVWTRRLEEWWAPRPWTTRLIELDLHPGGRSAMVMSGPDGAGEPMEGVILEVTPNRRIVLTDAFRAGWIPQTPFMVGFFEFTPDGGGTRYRAGARHWTQADLERHQEMGFEQGWRAVADQLAALAEAKAEAEG